MLSQKGLDQFYSTNFSALGRFYGRTLRIDYLLAGTPRPVSRTAVGLFEKFLLRGSQGTMPSGETHLQAFWVDGGISIS